MPAALREIHRLLKPNGFFDVVLPTEGGLAYSLARRISAQRYFENRFKMDYTPIIANEHVNTFNEVLEELQRLFMPTQTQYFPLKIPLINLNLIYSGRFFKK